MSCADPHSQTHHSHGVIYVDAATKQNVHVDALPHKTGLWRCWSRPECVVTQRFIRTAAGSVKEICETAHLACHISSLATRSQDARWKLVKQEREKKCFFVKSSSFRLTQNDYFCEYLFAFTGFIPLKRNIPCRNLK